MVLRALGSSWALLTIVALGACARSPSAPPPVTHPSAPIAPAPPAQTSDGALIAESALAWVGVPYRNGGTDPTGFDCSGFAQYVFAERGIQLPRGVDGQFRVGHPVRGDEISAGDLVFFATTSPGPSHVGIAVGPDAFVHAPSSSGRVRVERLSASYWSQRFVGARRVVESAVTPR
jgi:cell wall-associated NlpC family hydrolase